MLLKYLTDKNVPVVNNFTKTSLVEQTIEYWRSTEHASHQNIENIHHQQQSHYNHTAESLVNRSEHFPVNVMARNFCSWFYKNLNENSIQINDFWSDATCSVKMVDSSGEVKEGESRMSWNLSEF
jgi:hypothetical protein